MPDVFNNLINAPHSLTDKIEASGASDGGSIPPEGILFFYETYC